SFSWPRWGRLAGQKQKRRLKKGFNHAGGCRHSFCGNTTGLYGSLSAAFKGFRGCFSSLQAGSMPAFQSRETLVFRPFVMKLPRYIARQFLGSEWGIRRYVEPTFPER
ncbi:hypothetical protein ABU952_19450, partial [Bacillus amyloliquefaciens]|uniref:hypothetical protein n=1 Tax=Bacillus amyloliquefaciens TaxID=1390 RepID=UPI00336B6D14